MRHVHPEITFELQNHSFHCRTNMSPKHFIKRYKQRKETLVFHVLSFNFYALR